MKKHNAKWYCNACNSVYGPCELSISSDKRGFGDNEPSECPFEEAFIAEWRKEIQVGDDGERT